MPKRIFKHGLIGLFLAGSLTFAGCGGSGNQEKGGDGKKEDSHQHEGHDHNGDGHNHDHDKEKMKKGDDEKSAYICPMKCEGSASEEAGKCPECGMDLVKRSELDKEKEKQES